MSELQIAQLSRGHFFGESALHENKPRNANVVAKTTVECYVISSRLFNKHLSSLSNDIKDRTSRNMQYREEKLKQYYTGSHFESGMSMKDVEIVGFLGKGIVGQVVLVRTKVGEHYYAVKCINKSFVVKNEMAADVVAEMKLLKSLRSPFLSHMLFSDRDPEYVFMGFNIAPGGEPVRAPAPPRAHERGAVQVLRRGHHQRARLPPPEEHRAQGRQAGEHRARQIRVPGAHRFRVRAVHPQAVDDHLRHAAVRRPGRYADPTRPDPTRPAGGVPKKRGVRGGGAPSRRRDRRGRD